MDNHDKQVLENGPPLRPPIKEEPAPVAVEEELELANEEEQLTMFSPKFPKGNWHYTFFEDPDNVRARRREKAALRREKAACRREQRARRKEKGARTKEKRRLKMMAQGNLILFFGAYCFLGEASAIVRHYFSVISIAFSVFFEGIFF
jgi:hypothetical protein